LALLRGMVGRPGAGLLPIRGHSNVQGIGSVGVMPKLRDVVFNRLQDHFGVELPTTVGRDTMACMEGAHNGELKFGLCLGGNLYGSNPDASFAQQALENLDMLVYLSTTLNTGHAFGLARETIILPVLARDEEPQPTTQESMFNFVRLSDGGPARHAGPKSEVEVIAMIAAEVASRRSSAGSPKREHVLVASGAAGFTATGPATESNGFSSVLNGGATSDGNETALTPGQSPGLQMVDWRSMQNTGRIREAIGAIVPGLEKIAEIERTKQEFEIGGRIFHEPNFKTQNGRANLHVHELPPLLGQGERALRLMTIRSEGQFNTVVYEDYDLYRGVERRDVILIHPDDIKRLGLDPSMTVTVHGPAGSLRSVRLHPFEEIRPGNAAMYYPEANALVSRQLDPASKTPAFKCVIVRVEVESLALTH
jgi:anaerobic selenocysteine-containing dehydrogenase